MKNLNKQHNRLQYIIYKESLSCRIIHKGIISTYNKESFKNTRVSNRKYHYISDIESENKSIKDVMHNVDDYILLKDTVDMYHTLQEVLYDYNNKQCFNA